MKFIYHCTSPLFLISLLFLSGCGDSATSPSSDGFALKLTIVDRSGAPFPGLKLSRRCRVEYEGLSSEKSQATMRILTGADTGPMTSLQPGVGSAAIMKSAPGADPPTEFAVYPARPNPGTSSTNITVDVPVVCYVTLVVYNWKNDGMFDPIHVYMSSVGSLILFYPFTGRDNAYAPNGIYHVEVIATAPVDSAILFKDSVYFSGYTDNDPFIQSMGQTNTRGLFYTRNKDYFPSLQGHQPQMGYDYLGLEEGLFSFSNAIEIKVMTELPPDTEGYIYWMTREVVISDRPNEIEWVFVPDDSIMVP